MLVFTKRDIRNLTIAGLITAGVSGVVAIVIFLAIFAPAILGVLMAIGFVVGFFGFIYMIVSLEE